MAENQVVFVTEDVTLHQTSGEVTSPFGDKYENVTAVTLLPGESVPLKSLPKYQQTAVKNGEVNAVEVLSESEAKKKAAYIEKIRALVAGGNVTNLDGLALSGPDADDGSHSDHEVPDDVKADNHAKRGEEEAGSGPDPDEEKTSKPRAASETRKVKGTDAEEGELLEDTTPK